jgi:hypothetical protein
LKGRQQVSWRFFWRFHAGADAFWAFWGGEIGSVFRRLFERSERLVDDVLLFHDILLQGGRENGASGAGGNLVATVAADRRFRRRSLSEYNSEHYSFRLLFKRKLVNRPGQADKVVEFIDPNSDLAKTIDKE